MATSLDLGLRQRRPDFEVIIITLHRRWNLHPTLPLIRRIGIDTRQNLLQTLPAAMSATSKHPSLLSHPANLLVKRLRVAPKVPFTITPNIGLQLPQGFHFVFNNQPNGAHETKRDLTLVLRRPRMENVVIKHIWIQRKDGESELSIFTLQNAMLTSHRSINTGFNSLRQVLPANNESDSRATTLRKAVDYVNHLESLLQELRRDRPIAQNRGGDRAYIKGESE
jgi:hypothetical protein